MCLYWSSCHVLCRNCWNSGGEVGCFIWNSNLQTLQTKSSIFFRACVGFPLAHWFPPTVARFSVALQWTCEPSRWNPPWVRAGIGSSSPPPPWISTGLCRYRSWMNGLLQVNSGVKTRDSFLHHQLNPYDQAICCGSKTATRVTQLCIRWSSYRSPFIRTLPCGRTTASVPHGE